MEKLKQKLSSRKLWAAIVGVIVGLASAFGIAENEYAQVAGVVTSAVSVFAYIFGEAAVDASREKYGVNVGEILGEIAELEAEEPEENEETETTESDSAEETPAAEL